MLSRVLVELIAHPWRTVRARRAQRLLAAAGATTDADRARRLLERAVRVAPEDRAAWSALGDARSKQGAHGKAALCYRAALRLEPDPAIELRLARALRAAGDAEEAIAALRRAHASAPRSNDALKELVLALVEADDLRGARAVVDAALAAEAAWYDARVLLGFVHQKAHDPMQALEQYEAALAVRPSDANVHDLCGATFQELGRIEEAIAEYDRALEIEPGHVLARFHKGQAQLLLGDFRAGWEGYELRKLSAASALPLRRFPEWNGERLDGRTLLVRREQGLGDEIMFASMVPELVRSARHCIVECEPRLHKLFSRSFPGATVFPASPDRALPARIADMPVDLETAAGSVARYLRPDGETFGAGDAYLKADEARVAHWRTRLNGGGRALAVGISWTGGVRQTRKAVRSLPLASWLPLLQVPGTRFVSLQYTPEAAREVAELREAHGIPVDHWPEAIEDYDETAALVCALDLVISVCTSVVHLGGALGRPVWVLAPYSPEWRYGFKGARMPWYASVRVHRQPAYGAWGPVVQEVLGELRRAADLPSATEPS